MIVASDPEHYIPVGRQLRSASASAATARRPMSAPDDDCDCAAPVATPPPRRLLLLAAEDAAAAAAGACDREPAATANRLKNVSLHNSKVLARIC